MARRARRRPIPSDAGEPRSTTDEAAKTLNAMLIATIMEKIDKGPLYNLSAPQTLPIRQHDGQYRQRPIPNDEEFTFKGCRIGARNQVIFEFQPMDPTKFDQVELEERNVFEAFDGFEQIATAALGYTGDFEGCAGAWPHAKKAFMKGEKARRAQEVEDAETAAKKEIDDAYGSNSAFGSW
jgi:hypothetical protein